MSTDHSLEAMEWEARVRIVRKHYESKGYRVHSGLQFGCELVLYADDPSKVHSDFCVHVLPGDGLMDWRMIQSLVRLMPDLHKTLLLASLRRDEATKSFTVEELAMTSEHAPFRHKHVERLKKTKAAPGQQTKAQRKRQRKENFTPEGGN